MNSKPCPQRVFFDSGGAFFLGFIGSYVWNHRKIVFRTQVPIFSINNWYLWTRKNTGRLFHGPDKRKRRNVRKKYRKHLHTGGRFGGWGLRYAFNSCILDTFRKKEDILTPILAGGLAAGIGKGFYKWKENIRTLPKRFYIGATLLGVIEGFIMYMTPPTPPLTAPEIPEMPPS